MLLYMIFGYAVAILKVAVGLGFVIFVHELGHFMVAKLCGVKCEKFYLGFDIGGWKFCKFRRGETEYGIGILPLGGYVKMLGQEDNPARLREEMERARQKAEGEPQSGPSAVDSGQPSATIESAAPGAEAPIEALVSLDPRSYMAKSVPRRMAIISAGVVMNVIFAFLMAVVAFSIGVDQPPCVIGDIFPGEPAWQAGLRVGDEILEIAGKPMKQFRDLQTAITLGDIDPEKGVELLVQRPGVEKPLTITVKPDRSRGAFLIGVGSPSTNWLLKDRRTWLIQKTSPELPGSPADLARPAFKNGDEIVKIDNVPVTSYTEVCAELGKRADKEITVTVERAVNDTDNPMARITDRVTTVVPRNYMRTVGLVMEMGEITAVQDGSPAASAGIRAGDMIQKIDGHSVADPMTLPDELARRAGETVEVTLERKGFETPVIVAAPLREALGFFPPQITASDRQVEVPALGVAFHVLNRIDRVIEGSRTAKAGLLPGDVLTEAVLMPPDKEVLRQLKVDQPKETIPFNGTDNRNWPALMCEFQRLLPGTTVKLTYLRQEAKREVELEPVEDMNWSNPDRGFVFEPLLYRDKAHDMGEACAMGGRETFDMLTIVFRSVKKLSTNQVSMRVMSGPVGIVMHALHIADQGTVQLLLFLTFLSANLAVLNFLPIPVLDGGHMVFLAYEGIRGKPANEHVQIVLTYIGLALILTLFVWVMGLDFGWIARH